MEQKTQDKQAVPLIAERFKQIGESFIVIASELAAVLLAALAVFQRSESLIAIASELAAAAAQKRSTGKRKPPTDNKAAQEAKTSAQTQSPEKTGEQPAASNGNKPASLAGNTPPDAGNQANKPINPQRMKTIFDLAKANRIWANQLSKEMFGGKTVKELTDPEAAKLLAEIQWKIANGSK